MVSKGSYKNIQAPPPSATTAVVVGTQPATAPPIATEDIGGPAAAVAVGPGISLGRVPAVMDYCPKCSAGSARTRTRTYPSVKTWVLVGIGAIIFWPLCWIPLVVDPLKKTDHFCVQCSEQVGTVGPLEDCCVKEME